MAGTLTRGAQQKGDELVKLVAKRIAQDSPKLADLEPEALEKLARVVAASAARAHGHPRRRDPRCGYRDDGPRGSSRRHPTGPIHHRRAVDGHDQGQATKRTRARGGQGGHRAGGAAAALAFCGALSRGDRGPLQKAGAQAA